MEHCTPMVSPILKLASMRGQVAFACFNDGKLWIEGSGPGSISANREAMHFILRLRGDQDEYGKRNLDLIIQAYLRYA